MLNSDQNITSTSQYRYEDLIGYLRRFYRIGAAEVLKQHRRLFGNQMIYFSMFLWPILELGMSYYMFQPIQGSPGLAQRWSIAANPREIVLFFVTGSLGFTFFWSLVQSAWMFSFERFDGTLEILFLTPANRFMLILMNGAAALVQSVWLFLIFTVSLIAFVGGLNLANPIMFVLAFFALLIPALAWATFLNCFLIFLRNSDWLYSILSGSMSFLSGVRLPAFAYPTWIRAIGLLIPLTTSLTILRGALLERATLSTLWTQILFLIGISLVFFLAAAWLLKIGERHARIHGTLTLF